jgi:hypothetical protein
VSRDIQRSIYLEVTVPHIALPSLSEQAEQIEASGEAMEQVRLLALDAPATTAQEIARGEPSTYTKRTGLFHLFQCTATLLPQKLHLLHILRPARSRKGRQATSEALPPTLTDELAFSLTYRHLESDKPPAEPEAGFQAGSTHVVIQFDEEDIPNGYSVDGVEG